MRSLHSLDAAAFARLLARLSDDEDRAALEYESLRRALLRFFDWRGVWPADVAADETIDRLARRLAGGEPVVDLRSYALGIARLVALEHRRHPEARTGPIEPGLGERLAAPEPRTGPDSREACFDRCFEALPDEARRLIVQYYGDTGRARIDARAALAREQGMSLNALRLRAQRIRDRLEDCIGRCLEAAAPDSEDEGALT